jgi:hypothetical protein
MGYEVKNGEQAPGLLLEQTVHKWHSDRRMGQNWETLNELPAAQGELIVKGFLLDLLKCEFCHSCWLKTSARGFYIGSDKLIAFEF